MLFRRLSIIIGILVIISAITFSRYLSQQKAPPVRKESLKQIKRVEVLKVKNANLPSTLEIQGELVAFNKIDLFTEVSGTLTQTSKPFKVGTYFPKGSVLLKVDPEEAQLNLLSQKSSLLNSITQLMPDLKIDYPESFQQWKKYLDQFDPQRPIQAFPKALNDQEKYFIASRNLLSQYYNIKSAEERLSKYVLYAPFSGVITQTSINPGALVRAGQKLGELMNTNNYELEATVPLSDLKYIKAGNSVNLFSDDIDGAWTGKIKRINDQVDSGTQTVTVFVSVSGKNLREGMYLRGEVAANTVKNVVKIPRRLLVNQNAVYEVKDTLLRLHPIEVVKVSQDQAFVKGLEDGKMVLKEVVPGAFDGMRVEVRDEP